MGGSAIRCPHARTLDRRERRVVGAGHIGLGAALGTPVAGGDCGAHPVQLGSFRISEKLLVRISCRALQRRVAFLSPYSLQIGLAPGAAAEDSGASADPAVIDTAKPTLNATMARADTVLKLKRQSRMKVSFRLQWTARVSNSSNYAHDSASRHGPIAGALAMGRDLDYTPGSAGVTVKWL